MTNPTQPEIAAYAAATIVQELLETLIDAGILSHAQVADLVERAAQRHDAIGALAGPGQFSLNTMVAAAIMKFIPRPAG